MNSSQPVFERAARYLTLGSAVSILFSIAVSQILLALALAALLISGAKLRLPPIWGPLGLFLLGTLVSLALSRHPADGLPQVRKFFVFLMLLVVFSTVRDLIVIRRLFLCSAAAGALTALWGLVQFFQKMQQARLLGVKFYDYYTGERISGAMSHWMTFGGEEMFVLLMLGACLLFAPPGRKRDLGLWLACAAIVLLSLVLGFTRSIWLASAAGAVYLIWFWKPRLLLLAPVVLLAGYYLGPASLEQRVVSLFRPRKDVDSNEFRFVTWRTGLRMIRAHPWFGLGPEEVRLQFNEYLPPGTPRPLPTGWYGHLHNIYLHYAAERGIPTMLVLVWLLIKILWDFARAVRKLPLGRSDERFVLHGAMAVVLATMVSGIFELNLGDSEVLTMFLVVVACGYVAVERGGRKEPTAQFAGTPSARGRSARSRFSTRNRGMHAG